MSQVHICIVIAGFTTTIWPFKHLILGPDLIITCLLLPFKIPDKYSLSTFLTDVLLSSAYELFPNSHSQMEASSDSINISQQRIQWKNLITGWIINILDSLLVHHQWWLMSASKKAHFNMASVAWLFREKYILNMVVPGNALRNSISENVWNFTKLLKWIVLFRSFIFVLCIKPVIMGKTLM